MDVPSHAPLQAVPVPAQAARPPRGVPTTATHVPSWPVTLHAAHCPLHAVLQQTPSTQWPEAQAPSEGHAAPTGSSTLQVPPLHHPPAAHCEVDVQLEAQASVVPEHSAGKQLGDPSAAAASTVHVPPELGVPGVGLQLSHAPLQATLQHTPSAQKPVVHSLEAAQAAPAVLLAWHVPDGHLPEAHSPSAAHAWPLGRRGTHAPLSQKAVDLQSAPVVQDARHAPAPSQSASPHSVARVPSAATGLQVPSFPEMLQASQSPVQALPQHTPSTQESPLAQASLDAQAWPADTLGVQRLLLQ